MKILVMNKRGIAAYPERWVEAAPKLLHPIPSADVIAAIEIPRDNRQDE